MMSFITKFMNHLLLLGTVFFLSACGGTSEHDFSATSELQTVANNTQAKPLLVAPTGFNTNQVVSAAQSAAAGQPVDAGLPGIADVYIGALDLPYYFDPNKSLSSFWDKGPTVKSELTVPVMMTVPNSSSGKTMPASGWPVVIYQHGITRNRTDVLAYADGFARQGFAIIAIDLPTHGLVDTTNPFHAAKTSAFAETEQTFGVDAVTQDEDGKTTANVADGIVDSSGTHFINLRSLLTSRDNVRQGSANLLTLRKSLAGIVDVTGGAITLDTSKVGLVAHSLGGMVAVPYLGVESEPTPTSLVSAGATISKVLQESDSFSPIINKGLAGIGVTTAEAQAAFYADAQAVVDAGEPANYAAAAVANHPIHLIEVIGDKTVPNSATEDLANLMGATTVSTTTAGIAPGNAGIVRFTSGSHSTPLTPHSDPKIPDLKYIQEFTEMHSQMIGFQVSRGTVIKISNPSVIQGGM